MATNAILSEEEPMKRTPQPTAVAKATNDRRWRRPSSIGTAPRRRVRFHRFQHWRILSSVVSRQTPAPRTSAFRSCPPSRAGRLSHLPALPSEGGGRKSSIRAPCGPICRYIEQHRGRSIDPQPAGQDSAAVPSTCSARSNRCSACRRRAYMDASLYGKLNKTCKLATP